MRKENDTLQTGSFKLLILGMITLVVSQVLEGAAVGWLAFTRGVCIGLSLACCITGLYLYRRR